MKDAATNLIAAAEVMAARCTMKNINAGKTAVVAGTIAAIITKAKIVAVEVKVIMAMETWDGIVRIQAVTVPGTGWE